MKALMIATVVKKHILQFHIPYLKLLKEMGYETYVAAGNDYEDASLCTIPYCDVYYDVPFARNPWKTENLRAYRMLKDIMMQNDFSIIHCHTPVGGVLGRLAAKAVGKQGCTVIYTAHGFHFYKGAPVKFWLLYYPVEKFLSRYTDVLITINKEDYKRAKKCFAAKKTIFVPGVGVDVSIYKRDDEVRQRKRKEMGFAEDDFVILSVAELIKRKNHELLIDAMGAMKDRKQIKCLIAGSGEMEKKLKNRVKENHVGDNVVFLGYRDDVMELMNACDMFVFMSHQEGLPTSVMEAMACGLPVICSDVRGNRDLIRNNENGVIIPLKQCSPEYLAREIINLKDNGPKRRRLGKNAIKSVQAFSLDSIKKRMQRIYESAGREDAECKFL